MEKQGIVQSTSDPCLFIGRLVIAVVYVDDILLYSPSNEAIDSHKEKLAKSNIWIRRENTAEGFLGVDVVRRKNTVSGRPDQVVLSQPSLTKRIVEVLGLNCSFTSHHLTPAECSPLPKDINGQPVSCTFNYASIIGMLLYLSGHSRLDIAFAVHQCARYTFNPTHKHEKALIR
ncbi:hypothetical protein ACHAXS_000051, partial [Conticribra weissflogii]